MKWRWQAGRQGTGYEKLQLFHGRSSDAYLLRFPEGCRVPPHVDPVPGKRHYRLNVTLVRPEGGGQFMGGDPIFSFGCLVLFRPDLHEHSMTRIYAGHCIMLSIGVAL